MLHLVYIGEKEKYAVDFEQVTEHVVQVTGNLPARGNGFMLSRIDHEDEWDYSAFRTIYRKVEGGAQFSDDGSIYVEPEPSPEPEPYVPTLEEVKAAKLTEISTACEQAIYSGVDVALPSGTEHFSLTDKDQLNLYRKREQLSSGAERFEYHQDGHPFRYYTREEMQGIVEAAQRYIDYHTTYCNAINMWIRREGDADTVAAVMYGCDVPEAYQNEVLRDILVGSAAGNGEG